ncbi:uncharacterized protein LOC131439408 [Malaya genurostris]|uniref:uncharacterized protein LOC131439408 n=1 Tax=Malaya genurostris TaxID=325434 RepID=UPI0026F3EEE7|nr:uncharacterized protein LOC131439408 [Malaya genurostris]
MAYSSQRLFLHVPFKNEQPPLPDQKHSHCELKTYESCTDVRAWTRDPLLMSQFMIEVVHKSRFQRMMLRPVGDYELTREYLLQLSTIELTDYVLSIMNELKKVKSNVRDLTESRHDLEHQLASVQQIAEECFQEREEVILIQEQSTADLEETIRDLKCKAHCYDRVVQENQCLRSELQTLQEIGSSKTEQKLDDGACGDTEASTCVELKAELCIHRQHYVEMQHQKRTLMEQLRRAHIGQDQIFKLKNKLIDEKQQKEKLQEQLDNALIKSDRQELELKRMSAYIAMCNHRLERIESDKKRPVHMLTESSSEKSFESEGSEELNP